MTARKPTPKPKRLNQGQIIESLLARGSGYGSSVALTRNAKGDTQIEVVVRTDGDYIKTAGHAAEQAQFLYNRLQAKYPIASPEQVEIRKLSAERRRLKGK